MFEEAWGADAEAAKAGDTGAAVRVIASHDGEVVRGLVLTVVANSGWVDTPSNMFGPYPCRPYRAILSAEIHQRVSGTRAAIKALQQPFSHALEQIVIGQWVRPPAIIYTSDRMLNQIDEHVPWWEVSTELAPWGGPVLWSAHSTPLTAGNAQAVADVIENQGLCAAPGKVERLRGECAAATVSDPSGWGPMVDLLVRLVLDEDTHMWGCNSPAFRRYERV